MRPTSSTDGIGILRDLQRTALACEVEPVSLHWVSRVGVSVGFSQAAAAESFAISLANARGDAAPEAKVFGDVDRPQVSYEIELAGWEIRVYAPAE